MHDSTTLDARASHDTLDALKGDHLRVLRAVDMLETLLVAFEASGGGAGVPRVAVRALMKDLDIGAIEHHEGEELVVIPMLRAMGRPDMAERMGEEHLAIAQGWAVVRRELEGQIAPAEAEGPASAAPVRTHPIRAAAWRDFAARYRAHVALEQNEIFPLLAGEPSPGRGA